MEPQRNKLIQNISHEYQASFASLQYDQRKSRPLKGKSKQKLISYTVRTILQEKTNALNVRGSDQTRNKSINHVAHKRGKEKKNKGQNVGSVTNSTPWIIPTFWYLSLNEVYYGLDSFFHSVGQRVVTKFNFSLFCSTKRSA